MLGFVITQHEAPLMTYRMVGLVTTVSGNRLGMKGDICFMSADHFRLLPVPTLSWDSDPNGDQGAFQIRTVSPARNSRFYTSGTQARGLALLPEHSRMSFQNIWRHVTQQS